ncbi:hypothetical protein [Hahella ganghwensis]|uniref:hypothetical protein n=1 Tax=Hahella ganghwensis TaxID=286420 RepID=UPI00036BB856|nr:hypothetical protein [Hahella ganghwensis]
MFLVVGSLQPNQGGGIVAHNTTQEELEARINQDPFVVEKVVTAEVLNITPSMLDDRLSFLAA